MADRLGEIRARVGAASPGPWELDRDSGYLIPSPEDNCYIVQDDDSDGRDGRHIAFLFSDNGADAAFIANSPDDIRFLLAEVERLRAERDALRLALNRARALLGGQSDGR